MSDRPPPFDLAAERALYRRWAAIEANRDWWETFCAAARLAFGADEIAPEHADIEGNRRDFASWPEDRRQAWLAGWSEGFHTRMRFARAAEADVDG
jgi:hypothetical protein